MRAIVGWSLRFRLIVLGIAAAIMAIGVAQLSRAPVDVLPEFAPPYVEIQTEALGLSADEIEQLVTVPLEADLLHGVAFLHDIRSQSVAGLSSIVMIFDPGTNVYRARQMVAERLTQAHALPSVSKPPAMLQPLSSTSRVMMVGLKSTDVSLIDMSVLTRWTIRPRLLSVPGVANVTVWGQRERQLQVLVDPARLRDLKVSLADVIETTGNSMWVSPLTFLDASTPGTGGFIDTPNQRLSIQHVLPISGADELAKVTMIPSSTGPRTIGGRPLQLGDVAKVVEDHQPLIGDAIVDGGPGLVLVVEKTPGASTIDVSRGVEDALEAMKPGLTGITIDTSVFRPADDLSSTVSNISFAGLLALPLIVLAVGVLLLAWRPAVVALITIPVALVAAALVLVLAGETINVLTIGGLAVALAILVDDAVNGFHLVLQRRREPDRADPDRSLGHLVLEATVESRGAIGYATAIVLLAAVPMLVAGGTAGVFAPTMVFAYVAAVVASAIVALTLTPTLCLLLLSRGSGTPRALAMTPRIRGVYTAALDWIVRRTRLAAVALGALVLVAVPVLGVMVAPRIVDSALPSFRETNVLVQWNGRPGTSQEEVARVMNLAGAEIKAIPGVANVGGHVGRAILGDQVVGTDAGELWIQVDPAANYDATMGSIENILHGYPGLRRSTTTYPAERVQEVTSTTEADLTVRVYGQDATVLGTTAETVRQAVAGVSGVRSATLANPAQEPTLNIQVDLAAAEKYGVKPGDIRRSATTLLSGLLVGNLYEDQKVFDVVVWGTPALRQSVDTIRDLMIDTPSGGQVRLGDVASVAVGPGAQAISREGVFRFRDISIGVAGRGLDAVAADIHTALHGIAYPVEYRAEILGDYAQREAAFQRLVAVGLAAAVGIFLVLQAAFRSWRRAVLAFLAIPAAVSGGVLAAVAVGGGSIGTVFALLTVGAIAVRSAILLVTRLQRFERTGEAVGPALIERIASERFAPLVTTTIATAIACLALLALGERTGFELLRPMALVTLAGLVTSTLVSALVVPALYPVFASRFQEDLSSAPLGDQPAFEPTSS
jgi:Cu/Ag efflux pump CusA